MGTGGFMTACVNAGKGEVDPVRAKPVDDERKLETKVEVENKKEELVERIRDIKQTDGFGETGH